MGNEQAEKMMVAFADDLRKIMIKHGLNKISGTYGSNITLDQNGISLTRIDFLFKEDSLEVGHLSLDECLDLYNQKVHAWEVTKENEFASEAMEIMSYIKRRFKEIDV